MSAIYETAESIETVESPGRPLKQRIVRALLFLWTILVACPIRYWPIDHSVDNTWVFAMNYGAAQGLKMGVDLIWTTGPLGYLAFPLDIGNNLAQALGFQCALWVILIAIFADLFFRAGLELRNLAFFSVFFSLSAPLYWFNFMGLENLLLAGVLVLLVVARHRGGLARYAIALALTGVIPLIKLTGGMMAGGAILGFLADRAFRTQRKIGLEAALAVSIPAAVTLAGCWLFLPVSAFASYLKGSLSLVSGYSSAMSIQGDAIEFGGVAEVLIGIGAFLFVKTKRDRPLAWFLFALLAIPLLMSVKHGFVRQQRGEVVDAHVIMFFCFAGLALALISLLLPVGGNRALVAMLVLLNYGMVSVGYIVARVDLREAVAQASGIRGISFSWGALRLADTRAALRTNGAQHYSKEARVEPAIRALIGDAPVASLSLTYSGALMDGLNLQLYPVPQRYAAYTRYLDDLNARWIGEKGPRFLLFDGYAIDERHPWAETPAMWLEIYRWYDTRLLGARSLLLERRSTPRFRAWKSMGRSTKPFAGELEMPVSTGMVFWTMRCDTTAPGALQKLLFRIPEIRMHVDELAGARRSFRVLPEVLGSPVPGNALPGDLAQFASVLDANATARPRVGKLSFSGPGMSSYSPVCEVEFLAPAP